MDLYPFIYYELTLYLINIKYLTYYSIYKLVIFLIVIDKRVENEHSQLIFT